MKKIIVFLFVVVASVTFITFINHKKVEKNISDKVIRFHVIANSDTEEDQRVKLEIRDEILKDHENELSRLNSREESIKYINNNLKNIETKANSILKKENMKYNAKAILGKSKFPIKQYGELTFPAGEYTALRIVLGEGGGKNWWCVMFPPLCFIDITRGRTSKESEEQLKKVIRNDSNTYVTTFKQQTTKVEAATKNVTNEKEKDKISNNTKNNTKNNAKKLTPSVQFKLKSVDVLKKTFEKLISMF